MNKLILKLLQALWRLLSRGSGCCADIIIISMALFLAGCGGRPTICDGEMTQLGVIVPDENTVYGFQILNRLNGFVMNAPTNAPFKVQRETVSSNSYFGVISINEQTKTTVETPKK